jgi:hypothetical protein
MDGRTDRETDNYITTSLRLLPFHIISPVSERFISHKGNAGKPPAANSEGVFPV